jgi:hypothetical protein
VNRHHPAIAAIQDSGVNLQTPLNQTPSTQTRTVLGTLVQEAIMSHYKNFYEAFQNDWDPLSKQVHIVHQKPLESGRNWLWFYKSDSIELLLVTTTGDRVGAKTLSAAEVKKKEPATLFDILFPQEWHSGFPPCPFLLGDALTQLTEYIEHEERYPCGRGI